MAKNRPTTEKLRVAPFTAFAGKFATASQYPRFGVGAVTGGHFADISTVPDPANPDDPVAKKWFSEGLEFLYVQCRVTEATASLPDNLIKAGMYGTMGGDTQTGLVQVMKVNGDDPWDKAACLLMAICTVPVNWFAWVVNLRTSQVDRFN
ncbi:hypothetical protein AGMMS49543_26630 [Betaproteobacteria bacterium]|nr:hypothetical protein AGMMS49543_26630 [Betaproteobacteria bacterium]